MILPAMARRLLLISAALLVLAAAMWWWTCFPFVVPVADGLSLRWYHRLPEYRVLDTACYFDRLGFAFGKGWLGGMQAGEGDFMHRYWALDVPYWFWAFAAGVLSTLLVTRITRRVRCPSA